MIRHSKKISSIVAMLLYGSMAFAQLPVEVFSGDKKTTLDILFFRYFKEKDGTNSNLLFFNRNRVSIDYAMTPSNQLPQFGFTEAISYNHSALRGFAPVVVGSISSKGVYPKAGIQYARIRKYYTTFTWLVCETLENPTLDFFFLGRYTPRLTERMALFIQLELFHAMPTNREKNFNFTQRVRLGLKVNEFQFGMGSDIFTSGRIEYITTANTGGFLRYEF